MTISRKYWFAFWILLLPLCIRAQVAAASATIKGRVLDFDGRPVAGASISVFPMDNATSGNVPTAITDPEGRYSLTLPPYQGRTRVCAVKEAAGYPDAQDLVFTSVKDILPIVNLVPGGIFENVDIRLGPPDGIVDGVVVDEVTGAPLWQARITLRRTDLPNGIYSSTLPADGRFLFALPSAPIEITVFAPQHDSWSYADPQTGARSLVLQSREHRTLTIKLVSKK